MRETPARGRGAHRGLHFDEPLIGRLRARGVELAFLTLHVGAGTFQPVRTRDIAAHRMHSERYEIPAATVAAVDRARAEGRHVVAVGRLPPRARIVRPRRRASRRQRRLISSSRPATGSGLSTAWSRTSTCRDRRC
jgi:hypothetical protein